MEFKTVIATLLTMAPAIVFAADSIPNGWIKAGNRPNEFEVGVDSAIHHGGRASAYVKAIGKDLAANAFGTLMQTAQPGEYLGNRVRLSAWVKSQRVDSGWAGVWLRIDGPTEGNQPKVLAFDNMQARPIEGTADWKRVEIVLDVPKEAIDIAFGIILSGDGQVWLDDLKFEIVPASVPVTGSSVSATNAPSNLDFEK